jgi:hypothetical protein
MVKKTRTLAAYHYQDGNPIERETASPDNKNSGFISKAAGSERRTTQRFPIELPAELCILEMRIPGTTVNISSGGLLMKCSHDSVKVGRRVKVRITNWPNSSGKNSEVVLVIDGAVVRDSTEYVAVRRSRYQFVEA